MGTIAITGAASGLGAATTARLRADGHRVITVDLHDADVIADLGTPAGRRSAIDAIDDASGGVLDGLVTFAGVAGLPDRAGSLLISVNYFGSAELLTALRPLLARAEAPAAVAISSNATTCQPAWSAELVDACLDGDEERARVLADKEGSIQSYPAGKVAIARYVRRNAPTPEWIGEGIRLNAIAPGMIDTPLVAEGYAVPELAAALDGFPIPVGRRGRPEEIAGFVAYLLGPEGRFFCGSLLFMDGGTDAHFRADDWPTVWTP